MAKRVLLLLALGMACGIFAGCVAEKRLDAAGELPAAVTISNDELVAISRDMRAVGDKENTVAPANGKYAKRLARLTDRFTKEDGLDLNFKVYLAKEANANATADGSIRVYSGLMDMMTDNELLFVIGHAIGHVKSGNSLDKIRTAYTSSDALKAAPASGTAAGAALGDAQLSGLLHAVMNAQFSQKQESDADAYAYRLMQKYKFDTKAAVSALTKLSVHGPGGGAMPGHPGSGDRAKAVQAMIDAGTKKTALR